MRQPLPSWNAGAARTAILDFVDRVTERGGPDHVEPAERIAVLGEKLYGVPPDDVIGSAVQVAFERRDGQREYAYAGSALTDPDAEPVLDTASRLGWTVISMRDDWTRVFKAEGAAAAAPETG